MDISRIRKKLKEGEEKSEREEPQKTADIKTEKAQIETQKLTEPEAPAIVPQAPLEKEIEILAFKLGDEEYALRIKEVQEILKYQRITCVPRAPWYLKGITSLRGKVLPVIDLKQRLGLGREDGGGQKIIVIASSPQPVGVLVSSVLDVIRLPEIELLEPPPTLSEEERAFIQGVVRIKNRFISVLNVDEILKREDLWS